MSRLQQRRLLAAQEAKEWTDSILKDEWYIISEMETDAPLDDANTMQEADAVMDAWLRKHPSKDGEDLHIEFSYRGQTGEITGDCWHKTKERLLGLERRNDD